MIEMTSFCGLVLHQPQMSSCMERINENDDDDDDDDDESLDTVASPIGIPVEVTSGQASSCMESLETTNSAIDIPVEVTSCHRQPVVMLKTLDLSR